MFDRAGLDIAQGKLKNLCELENVPKLICHELLSN